MVEFFDYNCGWCKKGLPEVMNLIEQDKNLRVVLKEFPIFGGDSDYAAKAALASQKQGKYWEFHIALLGHEGKVTRQVVDEIAAERGLDCRKTEDRHGIARRWRRSSARTRRLPSRWPSTARPAFIIDNQLIPGYLPADGLLAVDRGGARAGRLQALLTVHGLPPLPSAHLPPISGAIRNGACPGDDEACLCAERPEPEHARPA